VERHYLRKTIQNMFDVLANGSVLEQFLGCGKKGKFSFRELGMHTVIEGKCVG
jgi:hypothetical protein